MVTVTARDPEGLSSSVDVTIMVTDVDEAPDDQWVVRSEMFPENGDGCGGDVFTAVDPEEKSVDVVDSGSGRPRQCQR